MTFYMPILISFIIGAGLGSVSAYHSGDFAKLFYKILAVLPILGFILFRFTPIMAGAGVGDGTLPSMIGDMFAQLPLGMQWGVWLFPAFFFGARICTWYYREYIYEPPEETKAQRRARLLIADRG